MTNDSDRFVNVLVGVSNRDKALPRIANPPLRFSGAALTGAIANNTRGLSTTKRYERQNRSAAATAAATSLKVPTEEKQDDPGLVPSASYYDKKSREAAVGAATTSLSSSQVGDLYNARTGYKPEKSTRSGAVTGAVKADRQSTEVYKPEKTTRSGALTGAIKADRRNTDVHEREARRKSKHGEEKPSYDLGFLYNMASTSAQEDFYSAHPALAVENVANEEEDRRNRASQAGIRAMAADPGVHTRSNDTFKDDMERMRGTDVHLVATQNAKNLVENMDDGGAAYKDYYLSQLLEEVEPQPQRRSEVGQYLGAGTLRSGEPAQEGVSPRSSLDSGWEEMSEKDRKKAIKAATKRDKQAEAEAKKAEKAAKKKEKDTQKQRELIQRQWEDGNTHHRLSWWRKRGNPELWPDWEATEEGENKEVHEFDHDEDGSSESDRQSVRSRNQDAANNLLTRTPSPIEEVRQGQRLLHRRRLRRASSLEFHEARPDYYAEADAREQSLDQRLGNVALDKKVEDRESLKLRAQRNSQATISEVNQAVVNKTGKAPSQVPTNTRNSWNDDEASEPEGVVW